MKNLARFYLVLGLALVSCITLARAADGVRVVDLRCEYGEVPTGIDVPDPRLSWKLAGDKRGQRQTAYQIRAYSYAALARNTDTVSARTPDLWDTGKVVSDETHLIRYGGKQLESSQQVFWCVRVWDENDQPSATSDFSTWTMGVLKPDSASSAEVSAPGWKAKWICAQAASDSLLMRKEFSVKPGLRRAIAHVTGLGQYELSLNGAKISKDLLTPGWTDYNDTILYDTREITGHLRAGANAVGLTLGNGMYHVERRNRFAKFTGSFGPLRAICQIELEYADGSKEFVVTDESWRTHPGAITYNSIFGGEDFDARLYPTGWNQPKFDDAKWNRAVAVVRPSGTLRGHSAGSEPLRAIDFNIVFEEKRLSETVSVFDFIQNASYMPRLRVSGPAGSSVRIVPAEVVNMDGSILRSTMGSTNRGISWWQYTKATDDVEEWFPQFYYVGCRYMQAELIPATSRGSRRESAHSEKLLDLEPKSKDDQSRLTSAATNDLPRIELLDAVIVHSSARSAGEFECSNPLLNKIRDLVRWAQRANMVSVLTDCPHREKLGWLEQYHLNGPAIRYEFDMARMFTKGMNDMADAQTDSGLVPNIAPEYTELKGAFRSSPEWCSAFIIVPWQQYQFCGDLDLLRTHYADMKRYFAYLENSATNDIISLGLGDWFDLGPKKSGASQHTPPPITASAFYFHDAWILAKVAALLEKPDDAKKFSVKAERIRRAYNEKFFNVTNGSYATGSQAANAIALVMGIVEPAHSNAVLASLVKDVESRDCQMTAGDIGFRYLLQALAQGGRSDLIYRMINQDEKPGYGYMIKKGETSLTEAWDANLTTSHNHFMLGQITEWFYKDLAGIDCDQTGAGFKKIIIRPQPVADLKWARARYNSVRGDILSEWRQETNSFKLKVRIPANTTATVFVPAKSVDDVAESGRSLSQAVGVKLLRQEKGHTVVAVESGEYTFESRH
jgi:alpha-L-rhamnosidase